MLAALHCREASCITNPVNSMLSSSRLVWQMLGSYYSVSWTRTMSLIASLPLIATSVLMDLPRKHTVSDSSGAIDLFCSCQPVDRVSQAYTPHTEKDLPSYMTPYNETYRSDKVRLVSLATPVLGIPFKAKNPIQIDSTIQHSCRSRLFRPSVETVTAYFPSRQIYKSADFP